MSFRFFNFDMSRGQGVQIITTITVISPRGPEIRKSSNDGKAPQAREFRRPKHECCGKKYRVRERAECTKMIKVRTRPNLDFVKNMWELQRARTPNVAKHTPKPSTKWFPNRNNIHPNGNWEESNGTTCNIQHREWGLGWGICLNFGALWSVLAYAKISKFEHARYTKNTESDNGECAPKWLKFEHARTWNLSTKKCGNCSVPELQM